MLLVAIADGRTIGERTTSSGTVVSFARSPDDDVWNTLTNEQKMEHLRYLCREDVAGAVFDVASADGSPDLRREAAMAESVPSGPSHRPSA